MLYSLGAVLGGFLSATALWFVSGLFGWIPLTIRLTFFAITAAALMAAELGFVDLPLPQNARQIPQSLFYRGVGRATLQFGFEMGTGVRTYVSATPPYLLAIALLLGFTDFVNAIAAGVGFGTGRAAVVWMRKWARDKERWDDLLKRRLTWMKPTTLIVLSVALVRLGSSSGLP